MPKMVIILPHPFFILTGCPGYRFSEKTARPTPWPAVGSAFSLVGLLVVISIIALLIGLVLSIFGRARSIDRQTFCQNRLMQRGLYPSTQQFLEFSRYFFKEFYLGCFQYKFLESDKKCLSLS